MAHWVLAALWVRHPRLRRGSKVSSFLCRASRRRSIKDADAVLVVLFVPSDQPRRVNGELDTDR
jgi:hypothetical protein